MKSSPRLDGDREGLNDEAVRDASIPVHAESVLCEVGDPLGCNGYCRTVTRAALVAAGVPELVAERDRLAGQVETLKAALASCRILLSVATDHGDILDLHDDLDELTADRDRARRVAVALEQQVAAVEHMHRPVEMDAMDWTCVQGGCEHVDACPEILIKVCAQCDELRAESGLEGIVVPWPCPTIRALSPDAEDREGEERG